MRGKYIVLEGGEGVGKTTQTQKLIEQLHEVGIEAVYIQEPGSTPFASELRELLKHGPSRTSKANVLTFNAARAETVAEIKQILETGRWVVADRSYLSTIVYQGHGEGQALDPIRAVCDFAIEEQKPDAIIVLNLPPAEAALRLEERGTTDYFEDMNSQFHDRIAQGYLTEAKRLNLPVIDGSGEVKDVFDQAWHIIEPLTKGEPLSLPPLLNEKLPEPLTKNEKTIENTTTNENNVFVLGDSLGSAIKAGALLQLSQTQQSLRQILTQQAALNALEKAKATVHHDFSKPKQLGGAHIIIEQASDLLITKLLGHLKAFSVQDPLVLRANQSKEAHKPYHIPANLDVTTTNHYQQTMDRIFENYYQLVEKMTVFLRPKKPTITSQHSLKIDIEDQIREATSGVLPLGTLCTVGFFSSYAELEKLIKAVPADGLAETAATAQKLYLAAVRVAPEFFKSPAAIQLETNRPGTSKKKKLKEIADEYLDLQSSSGASTSLVDVSLRNEMEILADILFESSGLSLSELRSKIAQWPYERKLAAFEAYIGDRKLVGQKPGKALGRLRYSWDITSEYRVLRDISHSGLVNSLAWQTLTPRSGYEVPEIIEEAGLSDLFEECFDMSYELYGRLQALGLYQEAQYAGLMGHRVRWSTNYSAREAFGIHELLTAATVPVSTRRVINQLHERLSEVQPLVAGSMKFVNQGVSIIN